MKNCGAALFIRAGESTEVLRPAMERNNQERDPEEEQSNLPLGQSEFMHPFFSASCSLMKKMGVIVARDPQIRKEDLLEGCSTSFFDRRFKNKNEFVEAF